MTSSATDVAAIAGLSELWGETLGDPRICIAVLDGPVDLTHPSLTGANLTQTKTLASGGGPAAEHGTHITSVIFGQHEGSVKGIAPGCRGLLIPIFADEGDRVACTQTELADAITKAVQAGASIINISAG